MMYDCGARPVVGGARATVAFPPLTVTWGRPGWLGPYCDGPRVHVSVPPPPVSFSNVPEATLQVSKVKFSPNPSHRVLLVTDRVTSKPVVPRNVIVSPYNKRAIWMSIGAGEIGIYCNDTTTDTTHAGYPVSNWEQDWGKSHAI